MSRRNERIIANATTDQLAHEYNLICQKKSNLSSAQRVLVVKAVHKLIKKGTLSYKTKK